MPAQSIGGWDEVNRALAQEQHERLTGRRPTETRWQAFSRSVLVTLILGGVLLGFAFYTFRYLTADSRFEDGCLARGAQVIHLDDGSLACDFGFGIEPLIFEP